MTSGLQWLLSRDRQVGHCIFSLPLQCPLLLGKCNNLTLDEHALARSNAVDVAPGDVGALGEDTEILELLLCSYRRGKSIETLSKEGEKRGQDAPVVGTQKGS